MARSGYKRTQAICFQVAINFLLIAPLINKSAAQNSPDADVSPNVSVTERFLSRPRGETGIPIGLWQIDPSLSVTSSYVDNVFIDSPDDRVSDGIVTAGGAVTATTRWSVHEVQLRAGAARTTYVDNDTENFTNVEIDARGRFDFGRSSDITVAGNYVSSVEQRTVLQTAAGAEQPVRFSQLGGGATLNLRQTRFREEIGFRFSNIDFDDAIDASDGSVIDQDFRDQDIYEAYYRQYIRLRPALEGFVQAEGRQRRFDNSQIGIGATQDSDSFTVTGGIAFDIQKAARGEIGIGYQREDFESDAFADFGGFSASAALELFVSDLTTVTIEGQRGIVPSAVIGAGGFFSSRAAANVDHELLRNLLLSVGAEYRLEEFQDIDRSDTTFQTNLAATYLIGRSVGLVAEYQYTDVTSDGLLARQPFDQNIFRLSLEYRP
ncbi:MAG: outer membrane beta-barrel protein [Pseudomonadota bacterium]